MEKVLLGVGIGLVAVVFPLVAAAIAFKRRRFGWGIATLLSIFVWVGWLVAIFALRQKAVEKQADVFLKDGEHSGESNLNAETALSCQNCGARTHLGREYTFILGIKADSHSRQGVGPARISSDFTQTPYQLSESEAVYLCNKCVALDERRRHSKAFQSVLFVLFGIFAISIPFSYYFHELVFITPTMLLIFVVPVAIYQAQALRSKETAPLRLYRNLLGNPEYPDLKGRRDPLMMQLILNKGEHLAMRLKRATLIGSAADAIFSHEDAKKMREHRPWQINLDVQRRAGTKYLRIAAGLGVLTLFLFFTLPTSGGWVALTWTMGMFSLTYLFYGIGIRWSGNPGGTLTSTLHWYCPYCEHELHDDDLPTPGYSSTCPNCGRSFGRKDWFE